MKSDL